MKTEKPFWNEKNTRKLFLSIPIILVLLVASLIPAYAYYASNVQPFQPGGSLYKPPDPWQTLWDGKFQQPPTLTSVNLDFAACTGGSVTTGGTGAFVNTRTRGECDHTVTKGEAILVGFHQSGSLASCSASANFNNTITPPIGLTDLGCESNSGSYTNIAGTLPCCNGANQYVGSSGSSTINRDGVCFVSSSTGTISSIDFYLTGSTGNRGTVAAEIYSTTGTIANGGTCASLGTLVATSTTVDLTILRNSPTPAAGDVRHFTFASTVTINAGIKYMAVVKTTWTQAVPSSIFIARNVAPGDATQAHVDNGNTPGPLYTLISVLNDPDEVTCGGASACEAYSVVLTPTTQQKYADHWFGGFSQTTGVLNFTSTSATGRDWAFVESGYLNVQSFVFGLHTSYINGVNPIAGSKLFSISNTAVPVTQDLVFSEFAITDKNGIAGAGGNCKTVTSSGTIDSNVCDNQPFGNFITWTQGHEDSAHTGTTWTWAMGSAGTPQDDASGLAILLMWQSDCPVGYNCTNVLANSDGTVSLRDRATGQSGIAISKDPVDLSVATTKQLGFFEYFAEPASPATNIYTGMNWGWFLTTNSTASTATNSYDPLHDGQVALVFTQYVENITANAADRVDTYVYIQKSVGQQLIPDSGAGTDPNSANTFCPNSATIYICQQTRNPASTVSTTSLVLNMTGGVSAGATTQGTSYTCVTAVGGGFDCQLGGSQSTQIHVTGTNQNITQTFPWLNSVTKYNVGFFLKSRGDTTIHTVKSGFAGGIFGGNANVISYFVPDIAQSKTTDSSFLGWLGGALGGAYNFVASGASQVIGGIVTAGSNLCNTLGQACPTNLGNSVISAIVSGLIQVVNILINGAVVTVSLTLIVLQSVLNQIGQFVGWGNIGDQFFSFASGVVVYFTTGLSDALTWLLRIVLRSVDLIKVANFWVSFYLGGLFNFMADLLNVIAEFVTFASKIVTFLGNSYVLIMVLFFLWYDADEGLAGWYNWFETTKWMAFVSYDFLERMINFGISSITWIFARIPTLDGTTLPELPTIVVSGGPHFPTFEMTALREGNFAALFGQVLGVSFLVWFETSGLPGSIGSNVTGTAAGVMAPFVTIFLILISVMGLLFILNIPAKMARGTFGLDDFLKPQLSSFSTGPVQTAGVSGHASRRHPERKAQIVINRGLGKRGFVPQIRRQKSVTPESQATS